MKEITIKNLEEMMFMLSSDMLEFFKQNFDDGKAAGELISDNGNIVSCEYGTHLQLISDIANIIASLKRLT